METLSQKKKKEKRKKKKERKKERKRRKEGVSMDGFKSLSYDIDHRVWKGILSDPENSFPQEDHTHESVLFFLLISKLKS